MARINCRCHAYPHDPDVNPCPPCRLALDDAETATRHGGHLDPIGDEAASWNYPPDDLIGWAEYRIGA